MKKIIVLAVLLVVSVLTFSQSQEGEATGKIIVRPIQVTSCAPIPSDLTFNEKPFGYMEGFKIWYLVKGEGFVSVKKDSLAISSIILPNGKDISKTRTGKKTYSMGSFPKASENGQYLVFEVEVKQRAFGMAEKAKIKGVVTVLTGDKVVTKKLEKIKFDGKYNGKLGIYTVSESKDKGFGGKDNFGLKIKGLIDAITELKLFDGDTEIKRGGWSGSGDERTYYFKKPKGEARIELTHWNKMEEKKISLSAPEDK